MIKDSAHIVGVVNRVYGLHAGEPFLARDRAKSTDKDFVAKPVPHVSGKVVEPLKHVLSWERAQKESNVPLSGGAVVRSVEKNCGTLVLRFLGEAKTIEILRRILVVHQKGVLPNEFAILVIEVGISAWRAIFRVAGIQP